MRVCMSALKCIALLYTRVPVLLDKVTRRSRLPSFIHACVFALKCIAHLCTRVSVSLDKVTRRSRPPSKRSRSRAGLQWRMRADKARRPCCVQIMNSMWCR